MRTETSIAQFEHLVIDSAVAPALLNEGFLPFLEQFAEHYHIHTIGSCDLISPLVERSNGLELPSDFMPIAGTVRESIYVSWLASRNLADLLEIPPKEMRNRVLYLKSTKRQRVLVNRLQGLTGEEKEEEVKSRACHLHLIAHAVETCSFGCIYCFADYNYVQPTTILFDCPERVKVDLQDIEIDDLITKGIPIYLGSFADMCSPESLFFRIPQRMLETLAGCRVFTVTKSPMIAVPEMLNTLKEHGATKVVFTYSNLIGFERNLPYNARIFPTDALRKLIDHGIDTVLLYKPLVPGVNDKPKQILRVLDQAAQAGIKEVSMGFLQMDPEMEVALSRTHEPQYKYFDHVLTDMARDERIPSLQYREHTVSTFADICAHLGLRLSFCQAYAGALESELASSYCVCRPERWSM